MLLVVNGYIKTIVNGDIENGCVLIDDDGKIAAVGDHNELLASCDIYREVYEQQTRGGALGE